MPAELDNEWNREIAPFRKMTVRERSAAIRALQVILRASSFTRDNSTGTTIRSMLHRLGAIEPHLGKEALAEVSHVSKWPVDGADDVYYALVKMPGAATAAVAINARVFAECINEGAMPTSPRIFREIVEERAARETPEMTPEEQLDRWVDGDPVHNHNRWISIVDDDNKVVGRRKLEGGECCPDFSCCHPELLAPPEVRQAFKAASTEERGKFLHQFLAAMLKLEGDEDVHVVGGDS
jgi:hypothetical protein